MKQKRIKIWEILANMGFGFIFDKSIFSLFKFILYHYSTGKPEAYRFSLAYQYTSHKNTDRSSLVHFVLPFEAKLQQILRFQPTRNSASKVQAT